MVTDAGMNPAEIFTSSRGDRKLERWLQRTLSQVGEQLAVVRDRIFELAQPQRHHVVLDLNAGSGLLAWEALRRVPEGGVYACVRTQLEAKAIQEQATVLPELIRPVVLPATLTELANVLATRAPDVLFDRIFGRNALGREPDKVATVRQLVKLLRPSGVLVLAETIPRHAQRLYRLLDPKQLNPDLYERLVQAEEAIYANALDPMVNWDTQELRVAFEGAGLVVEVATERNAAQMYVTPALLERWFTTNATSTGRPSYAEHLLRYLSAAEVRTVQDFFTRSLLHQAVRWSSTLTFVKAIAPK
jgi:putative ATPase